MGFPLERRTPKVGRISVELAESNVQDHIAGTMHMTAKDATIE